MFDILQVTYLKLPVNPRKSYIYPKFQDIVKIATLSLEAPGKVVVYNQDRHVKLFVHLKTYLDTDLIIWIE